MCLNLLCNNPELEGAYGPQRVTSIESLCTAGADCLLSQRSSVTFLFVHQAPWGDAANDLVIAVPGEFD